MLNTCIAELLSIFHSFEAGIADAISSFKWMKNKIIYEKQTSPILYYLINWASTTRYVTHFGVFFNLVLNVIETVFTIPAAQGLIFNQCCG